MNRTRPAVSVVVATRNRARRLERLIGALERQTLAEPFEVVIVDDGSSDGTPAVLERAGATSGLRLSAVPGPGSRGPAAARNHGWRASSAELVAFTDDDCEPAPQWLEAGLRAWAGNPARIVQGSTYPNPAERDRLGPLSRTKLVEGPTPFFQTCNIFYPRPLLDRVDGFDERFPGAAGEDADLGWRALGTGAHRLHEPEAVVHHAVEVLTPGQFVLQGWKGAESALAYRRHPELRKAVQYRGLFWSRGHARLAMAIAGIALARRRPLALALALPYMKGLRGRARTAGGSPGFAGLLVAHDLLDTAKAIRGSIQNRVWML